MLIININEYMEVNKFVLAQARKVWTAAAAWSSGGHKESCKSVAGAQSSKISGDVFGNSVVDIYAFFCADGRGNVF